MVVQHLLNKLFILPLILLFWGNVCLAGMNNVHFNGDCSLSEGDINDITKEAASETQAAKTAIEKLNSIMKNDYENSNGVCHYLKGSIGRWWEEAFTEKLSFSSSARNGAQYAGNATAQAIEAMDSDEYKKYTDRNIKELLGAANDSKEDKYPTRQQCINKLIDASQARDEFIKHRKNANNILAILFAIKSSDNDSDNDIEVGCNCKREDGVFTGKIDSCTAIDKEFKENNMSEGCKPVTTYAQELSEDCLICGLFSTILGSVQTISEQAFEAIADGLIKLLEVALLLYIAYLTLITIASPETQKISKYLNNLVIQGAKVAIAVLLLQNPAFLYSEIITPILDGGVDFGLTLTEINKVAAKELGSRYSSKFNMNSDYLPGDILIDLTGTVHSFQNAAADMPGIGRALICYSFDDLPLAPNLNVIPRFSMLINGLLLYIFGLGIMLSIGFYMLDCILSLGIICALMSFFIACWPFKYTSQYTKIGWNMFLNVFFNFVMMSVVIKTIVEISTFAVSGGSKEELMALMASGDVKAIDNSLDLGGLQIVLAIVCCLICFKLPKEAGRLANKFASGAQIRMAAELGGLAMSAAKKATVGGLGEKDQNGKTQGIGGAVGLVGKTVGGLAGSAAEHSGAKGYAKNKINAVKNIASQFAGKFGSGKNAKMGAKGRDQDANNQNRGADFQ